MAKYLVSQRVNEVAYKVVMAREGSDELFGGYPAFRRDMFLHGLDDLPASERAEWQELLQGAMLAADVDDDPALGEVAGFTLSCLQPWLACAPLVLPLLHPASKAIAPPHSTGISWRVATPSTKLSTRGSR